MKERYFPAVHLGPTRIGLITGLELWRIVENTDEPTRTFLLEYGFDGLLDIPRLPRIDDEDILAAFETYAPYFQHAGDFTEQAVWPLKSDTSA
jgi:hypothetical protein